jgi:hypothetical protein
VGREKLGHHSALSLWVRCAPPLRPLGSKHGCAANDAAAGGHLPVMYDDVGVGLFVHPLSPPEVLTARDAAAPPGAVDGPNGTRTSNQEDDYAEQRDSLYDPEQRNIHRLL